MDVVYGKLVGVREDLIRDDLRVEKFIEKIKNAQL